MAETASRAAKRPRASISSKDKLVPRHGPTEEEIRQRAYEIYVARGGTPGDPRLDWQQAELELRARIALLGRV